MPLDNVLGDNHDGLLDDASDTSVISQLASEKAKRAALLAKAKTLNERHSLRKQQLLLDLKCEQLQLEEELSMCEARHDVYRRFELDSSTPHPAINQRIDKFPVFDKIDSSPSPITNNQYNFPTLSLSNNTEHNRDFMLYKLLEKQVTLTESLMEHQNQTLLPQPEIKIFNGKPLEYRTFIRAFEHRIERRIKDTSDRLYYLDQLTEGEPNKLVRSCLHLKHEEGFLKAKQLLKDKFGDKYSIATAQSNELLEWEDMKADNINALNQFSIALISCLNAMTDITYLAEMNNPKTIYKLMFKLPFGMRDKWRNKAQKITRGYDRIANFKDFVTFVQWEVDVLTDPVYGRVLDNTTSKTSQNVPVRSKQSWATSTEPDSQTELDSQIEPDSQSIKDRRLCYYCEKSGHSLDFCFAFQKISYEERREFARSKQLCYGCLSKGHDSRLCSNKSVSRKCDKPHPTCLHFDTLTNVTNGFVENPPQDPNVLMSIIPVQIKVKNSRTTIKTYAFLDNGSSGCFSTTNIKNRLGINNCDKTSILLGTMHGQPLIDSYVIKDMMVSSVNRQNYIALPKVYVRDQIPVDRANIPTKSTVQRWNYLRNLDIPELFKELEIGLLIGTNCVEALEPLNVIPSQNGGPFAVLTKLGWTINGVVSPLKESFSVFCNHIFLKEMNSDTSHKVVVKESVEDVFDPAIFCEEFERKFDHLELSSPKVRPSIDVKRILETNTTFNDSQLYVPLPVKNEYIVPNNKPNKQVKLISLEDLHVIVNHCLQPAEFNKRFQRELHVFSDANSTEYGLVPYQRLISDRAEIICSFIVGKFRLAPDISGRWLTGPAFLLDFEHTLSLKPVMSNVYEYYDPVEQVEYNSVATAAETSNPRQDLIEYFSNCFQVKRVVACVLHIKRYFRKWSQDRSAVKVTLVGFAL